MANFYEKNLTTFPLMIIIIVLFNKIQGASSWKWTVKVTLEDKNEWSIPLTAFNAPQGHIEGIVTPFGLKNAPQILQRRMENIFKDLNHYCLVHIDNILVISKAI